MDPTGPFPFVRSVVRVEEVDSTNDLARRLLDRGELEVPALVWAGLQVRGRGQGSNAWWSDDGSLTATVAIDPRSYGLAPNHEPRVALATATAILGAIGRRYPACPAAIRWPNDIEAGGRKLGGILAERIESPDGPRLLIGIGLNVTARLIDAPEEVRRLAASLTDWEEVDPSDDPRAALLDAILGGLEPAWLALAAGRASLVEAWNRRDALAGSFVRVRVGPEIIQGIAEGIDESGALVIRAGGQSMVVHAGRVLRD